MIAIKSFPCPLYWNRHPLGLAHSVLRKTEKNAHSYVWLFFTTTTTTPRSLSFLLKKNIAKKQNHRNRRRKKTKKNMKPSSLSTASVFPQKNRIASYRVLHKASSYAICCLQYFPRFSLAQKRKELRKHAKHIQCDVHRKHRRPEAHSFRVSLGPPKRQNRRFKTDNRCGFPQKRLLTNCKPREK